MKKTFGVLLIFLMLFIAFCSCGNKKAEKINGTTVPDELIMSGGLQITYEVSLNGKESTRDDVEKICYILRKRLKTMDYNHNSSVYVVGDDLIRVEIAGVQDKDHAEEIADFLGQKAELHFSYEDEITGQTVVALTGKDVVNASVYLTPGQPEDLLGIELNSDAAEKMAEITEKISGFSNKFIDLYIDNSRILRTYADEIKADDLKDGFLMINMGITNDYNELHELAEEIKAASLDYTLDFKSEKGELKIVK